MKAIYYRLLGGYVTKTVEASFEIVELNKQSDEAYIEGELGGNTGDYRVLNGLLVKKPEFDLAITASTISNIPAGTTVCVNLQQPYLVNDGSVTLSGSYAEEVNVALEHPEYLTKFVKVAL